MKLWRIRYHLDDSPSGECCEYFASQREGTSMSRRWLTREGVFLDVRCMTCDHLRHSIARILRTAWRLSWLDRLTDEYARRCSKRPICLGFNRDSTAEWTRTHDVTSQRGRGVHGSVLRNPDSTKAPQ